MCHVGLKMLLLRFFIKSYLEDRSIWFKVMAQFTSIYHYKDQLMLTLMSTSKTSAWGLTLGRILLGFLFFYNHGLVKLLSFSKMLHSFPNPIGLGSEITFVIAVGIEVGCALMIILGFYTRVAALFGFLMMATAFIFVHGQDSLSAKELPALYAIGFIILMTSGGGHLTLKKD